MARYIAGMGAKGVTGQQVAWVVGTSTVRTTACGCDVDAGAVA